MQPGSTNGEGSAATFGANRAPRSLEQPEALFTAIFIPIAAFSWVGILLAELGAFTGWRVFVGGALLSAVALVAARRDLRSSGLDIVPVSLRTWLSLAVLVTLSALLLPPPGEYIIEGADASVYLATGRNIQRTGGISSADPLVELMPQELRPSFFLVGRPGRQQETLLPGGLPIGADGKVTPSFFHLLPVWIAIATSAIGPSGGYFVNVVMAALGIIAVCLLGRRLWSPAAGVVAAVLLVVNFGQIFHARVPSSELLTQFMTFSGILFTLLAWDSRTRLAGACAGAAIGLAAFTRIDALLLMVPSAAFWLVLTRRWQSLGHAWSWYAALLAAVAGHAALHGATVAGLYTQRLFGDGWIRLARTASRVDAASALAAVLAFGVGAFLIVKFWRRGIVWVGLSAALALVMLSPPLFVMVSRLISPVGLAAMVAGLALLLARRADRRVLPLIIPLSAQAVLFVAWSESTILPNDFRRAVPMMLPGAMLLIGFLVAQVGTGRARAARGIWLLPIGLAVTFLMDAAPILRTPPMRGVHAQVAQVAGHIPPTAVVVTDGSVPGHLALALRYGFDRSAVRMAERPAGADGISPLINAALAAGRPVVIAVTPLVDTKPNRLWRSDFADFDIQHEATVPLRYTVLAPVRGTFPRQLRSDDVPVALYRVSARDRETRTPLPFVIDVGGDDFRALVDGFHASEQLQSASARWTSGDSRIALPRLAGPTTGTLTLVLRLSADRPAGNAPAAVQIALDGIPAGTISNTTSELREYRIPLSGEILARLVAGPTMLAITSDVFVPKVAFGGDDDRRLGVVLDWVRIE